MAESADAGLHRCPTCGGLARVVGGVGGRRHYRSVIAPAEWHAVIARLETLIDELAAGSDVPEPGTSGTEHAEIAALREGLDWALREGGWRLIEQASTPPPPIIARGPIGEPGRRRSGDDDHDG